MYSWVMFGDITTHPSTTTCVCTSGTVPQEEGSRGQVHVDNQLSLMFKEA